jgi:DNA-binding NarL/FixJ family response regulator
MQGDARELLAHIMPALVRADPWDHGQNGAVCWAGTAIWELRDGELAAELLPSAQALIDAGVRDYCMASNELTAARLTTLVGRAEEALELFERARATLEERGERPLRAIVDRSEGVARRMLRQPGAAQLLSSAQAQFDALGMTHFSRLAGAMGEPERADLPDGLTRREAEILRLLAGGRTNKEIAAELVLSVHTVERHLLNAYRKASVRNRADATAYVLRADL